MKKKILITGEHSYIGNSFEAWMQAEDKEVSIVKISLRDGHWTKMDFSAYDCILHVAGIAHVDAAPDMEAEYYRINRDLTIAVAKKAKDEGVLQFIFLSSMIVYGESGRKCPDLQVHADTSPAPTNFYGNSKLQAEEGIQALANDAFCVSIIRPPMVYGKGAKGNYRKLAAFAKKIPVFPRVENQRSMLYIEHLCAFLKILIERRDCGIFCPQNAEYVNTTHLVKTIARIHKRRVLATGLFRPALYLLGKKSNMVHKVFGTMTYDHDMSEYPGYDYNLYEFEETIRRTEGVAP